MAGVSRVSRLVDDATQDTAVPGLGAQWRQLLAGRADVRSALFAAGVILVEGETETGAFDQWFRAEEIAGKHLPSPESLNLLILSVGGDELFGQYAAYLDSSGIAWSIVCDGPVMAPNYRGGTPLIEQLRRAGLPAPDVSTPEDSATFPEWKMFWASHRVHTLASTFGGLEKDSKDKSGEIEAFFDAVDASRWAEAKAKYPKSKVRAGHYFAEEVACPADVTGLYGRLVNELAP
jgi:hypothetical protein